MTNQTINASSIQHQREEEQDDEMKKKERDWDSEGIKSSSFKGTLRHRTDRRRDGGSCVKRWLD